MQNALSMKASQSVWMFWLTGGRLTLHETFVQVKCSTHQTLLNAESLVEASEWLKQGHTVVCRTVLNGHSGNGIIIAENEDELVKAPLYTRYVKKQNEYRVHVFNGKMIHKQRKARRLDVPDEEVDWKVRNHDNGFIFQIEDFDLPEDCEKQAIAAVEALGLDFGAVDVVYNGKEQKAYVLEVNSAPGLSGTTLDKYVEVFSEV